MAPTLKECARWFGTVGVLLTAPLWMPVYFLIFEINWRGMFSWLRGLHEIIWRE